MAVDGDSDVGHPDYKSVAAAAAKSRQSCPTLCDPIDSSPPGSPVPGILQARTLEWVAISFSRKSSWPRYRTWVSCIAGRFFTIWVCPSVKWILTSQTLYEVWMGNCTEGARAVLIPPWQVLWLSSSCSIPDHSRLGRPGAWGTRRRNCCLLSFPVASLWPFSLSLSP